MLSFAAVLTKSDRFKIMVDLHSVGEMLKCVSNITMAIKKIFLALKVALVSFVYFWHFCHSLGMHEECDSITGLLEENVNIYKCSLRNYSNFKSTHKYKTVTLTLKSEGNPALRRKTNQEK